MRSPKKPPTMSPNLVPGSTKLSQAYDATLPQANPEARSWKSAFELCAKFGKFQPQALQFGPELPDLRFERGNAVRLGVKVGGWSGREGGRRERHCVLLSSQPVCVARLLGSGMAR